jgi:hypothetical protein
MCFVTQFDIHLLWIGTAPEAFQISTLRREPTYAVRAAELEPARDAGNP